MSCLQARTHTLASFHAFDEKFHSRNCSFVVNSTSVTNSLSVFLEVMAIETEPRRPKHQKYQPQKLFADRPDPAFRRRNSKGSNLRKQNMWPLLFSPRKRKGLLKRQNRREKTFLQFVMLEWNNWNKKGCNHLPWTCGSATLLM